MDMFHPDDVETSVEAEVSKKKKSNWQPSLFPQGLSQAVPLRQSCTAIEIVP